MLINLTDPKGVATTFHLTAKAVGLTQTLYSYEIRKPSTNQTTLYWDLSACMTRLKRQNQQSFFNEEIAYCTVAINDSDGANTTSAMTVLNDIVICEGAGVLMPLKAGDHEKRYTIMLTVGLVDDAGGLRIIEQRATLYVQNPGLHPALP